MKTYRKLFDILVVLALLGVEMIGLGDRVVQYVDGTKPLSALEIEQLRQDLNRAGNVTDAVTGWLPNGGETPTFGDIYARRAVLATPPLSSSWYGSYLTAQTIPDSTGTPMSWANSSVSPDSAVIVYSAVANSFQISPIHCGNLRVITVLGNIDWNVNAGIKKIIVFWYKKSDDTLLSHSNYLFMGTDTDNTSMVGNIYVPDMETALGMSMRDVYFKVMLYQFHGHDANALSSITFTVIN